MNATAMTGRQGKRAPARTALTLTSQAVVQANAIDFQYQFDYDQLEYAETRDCQGYGCDGICRCLRISDARVTGSIRPWEVAETFLSAYQAEAGRHWQQAERAKNPRSRKVAPPVIITDLDRAGIEWIVRAQNLTGDDFDVEVRGGYYGDEISKVHLMDSWRINTLSKEYLGLPQDAGERLRWLYNGQYGPSPGSIDHSEITIEKIPVADLSFTPRNSAWFGVNPDVYTELNTFDAKTAREWNAPLAIVSEDQGQYTVIEGAERLESLTWKQVPVWVARPPAAQAVTP